MNFAYDIVRTVSRSIVACISISVTLIIRTSSQRQRGNGVYLDNRNSRSNASRHLALSSLERTPMDHRGCRVSGIAVGIAGSLQL